MTKVCHDRDAPSSRHRWRARCQYPGPDRDLIGGPPRLPRNPTFCIVVMRRGVVRACRRSSGSTFRTGRCFAIGGSCPTGSGHLELVANRRARGIGYGCFSGTGCRREDVSSRWPVGQSLGVRHPHCGSPHLAGMAGRGSRGCPTLPDSRDHGDPA